MKDYTYLGGGGVVKVKLNIDQKVSDEMFTSGKSKMFTGRMMTKSSNNELNYQYAPKQSKETILRSPSLDNLNSVDERLIYTKKSAELHDAYDQFTYNIVIQHCLFQGMHWLHSSQPNIQSVVIRYASALSIHEYYAINQTL